LEKKNSESKNRWFQIFEIFQKIKELLGPGKFEKKKVQIQRMAGCGYFKNFKEPLGFMKEPGMTQQL